MYEAVIATYQTAYISNFASLFYTAPATATRLAVRIGGRYEPRYRSDAGFVSGFLAPSEAGPLFRYWFGDAQSGGGVLEPRQIRQAASLLGSSFGGPLVVKNLFLTQVFDRVIAVFPRPVINHATSLL